MLRVFDRLYKEGATARLVIVGRLELGEFVSHTTKADQYSALAILQKHRERIIHHPSLPHGEVLELMKHSQWHPTGAWSLSEPVEFANDPLALRQNEFKDFVILSAL